MHVDIPEFPAVCASAGRVDETPSDARNDEVVGDDRFDDRVEHLFA